MPERQSFVLCPLSFVLIGEAVRPATFAARLAPPYLGALFPRHAFEVVDKRHPERTVPCVIHADVLDVGDHCHALKGFTVSGS